MKVRRGNWLSEIKYMLIECKYTRGDASAAKRFVKRQAARNERRYGKAEVYNEVKSLGDY